MCVFFSFIFRFMLFMLYRHIVPVLLQLYVYSILSMCSPLSDQRLILSRMRTPTGMYRLLSHVLWSEYHTSSEYIYIYIFQSISFMFLFTLVQVRLNYRWIMCTVINFISFLSISLTRSVGRSFDACDCFCSKIVFGFHIKSCRTF